MIEGENVNGFRMSQCAGIDERRPFTKGAKSGAALKKSDKPSDSTEDDAADDDLRGQLAWLLNKTHQRRNRRDDP